MYLVTYEDDDYYHSDLLSVGIVESLEQAIELVKAGPLFWSNIYEIKELGSMQTPVPVEIDWLSIVMPELAIGARVRVKPAYMHPNSSKRRKAMGELGLSYPIIDRRLSTVRNSVDVRIDDGSPQPLWFHDYQVELEEANGSGQG